jgi:hypothetical protein
MISAFIFVISTLALIQFGVFTWRAGLLRVAAESMADQADYVNADGNSLSGNDFQEVLARHELCPDLKGGKTRGLRLVQVYYNCMRVLNKLGDVIVSPGAPGFGDWTQREMALCARYTAAVLSQRLHDNQMLAEQARSF